MFDWLWGKQQRSRKTETPILKPHRNPKVYLSYRRHDSAGTAGRLFDLLCQTFGPENLFIDVDTIAPGLDFVEAIKQEVQFADIFLVLIGPEWARARNSDGQSRILDPTDFVRLEIESALASGKPIIPVLLNGARIPFSEELPASLKGLVRYNCISLDHATFRRDVDQIARAIRQVFEAHSSEIAVSSTGPKSVFISHSTSDRDWVEGEIVNFLSINKLKPWYSANSISTSAQWEREILKGMQACEWFSLVVSPAAAESDWVKDELFWAMENRPTRIVPIIMKKCDLYKFHIRLPRIQHVDFTGNRTVACQKLLAAFNEETRN